MFDVFNKLTKATLGAVFSPVSMAADLLTMGGLLTDRGEPYTVTSFRAVIRNMELAFNPDELTDAQVQLIISELIKAKR